MEAAYVQAALEEVVPFIQQQQQQQRWGLLSQTKIEPADSTQARHHAAGGEQPSWTDVYKHLQVRLMCLGQVAECMDDDMVTLRDFCTSNWLS